MKKKGRIRNNAMKIMREVLCGTAGCFLALPIAYADADPQPVHDFSANATITTEYLFRGISQTSEDPALQIGFDYTHTPSGFYLGTWASNIAFDKHNDADDSFLELDFYGGVAGEFGNGISWDVGGLYYYYPDQEDHPNYNCLEVYGGLDYTFDNSALKPTVGVKLSYSNDYFGEDGNSLYSEGSLGLSLPQDFGLGFHLGFANVEGDRTTPNGYDYLHGSATLSKELGGFDLALSYHGVVNQSDCPATNKDFCKAVVFSASRSF